MSPAPVPPPEVATPVAEAAIASGQPVDGVRAIAAREQGAAPTLTAAAPVGAIAPVVTGATTGARFITAGMSATGATQLAAGTHTTATPGTIQLLTPADAALVDRSLAELQRSPSGAPVLDALRQRGAKVEVLADADFDRLGQGDAGAFFTRETDVLSIRRTWLEKNPAATASIIAHEALHAVDDASGLQQGGLETRARALSEQPSVPQDQLEEKVKQMNWELSIASEARAFLVQGQVLRELGQLESGKVGGALLVAAQGGNDAATYDKVFQALVTMREGGYNPDGRAAASFAL